MNTLNNSFKNKCFDIKEEIDMDRAGKLMPFFTYCIG
jgi:hypothetical protein